MENKKISYTLIEKWFNIYYKSLCQRAVRLVKEENIAEDIVQNIFFKLWKKGKSTLVPDSPEAFLKTLVFNESIDWLRKSNRYTNEFPNKSLAEIPPFEFEINEITQSEIIKNKLHEILDDLPPKCHTIFILSRFENLTYEEIANYLGISAKTVENQISKAIKHIKNNFPKDLLPIIIFYSNWLD